MSATIWRKKSWRCCRSTAYMQHMSEKSHGAEEEAGKRGRKIWNGGGAERRGKLNLTWL
jgi:hypothetical protein